MRKTAVEATKGAKTDLDKVRAIYQWVVANAHREPTVRGCGSGDIKAMLETGNLGGKCADLNAVFVGLCRSAGIPARDVYGLRLAPSAFGYGSWAPTRQPEGRAALPRRSVPARARLGGDGPGRRAEGDAPGNRRLDQDPAHPVAAPVMKGLFGRWEGNWVGWNTAHDVTLPGSERKGSLPFLMYLNGENDAGSFDELAPDAFKYTISAKEIV